MSELLELGSQAFVSCMTGQAEIWILVLLVEQLVLTADLSLQSLSWLALTVDLTQPRAVVLNLPNAASF